jgi:hypothetical protein
MVELSHHFPIRLIGGMLLIMRRVIFTFYLYEYLFEKVSNLLFDSLKRC